MFCDRNASALTLPEYYYYSDREIEGKNSISIRFQYCMHHQQLSRCALARAPLARYFSVNKYLKYSINYNYIERLIAAASATTAASVATAQQSVRCIQQNKMKNELKMKQK